MMRDFRGQRPAAQDHLADAFGAEERAAEIAAGDVSDPGEILHHERVAQPELRHVVGALRFAELGKAFRAEDGDQRIAGQDAQDHEDDDRDADHRQRAEGQSADDVAVHQQALRRLGGQAHSERAAGPVKLPGLGRTISIRGNSTAARGGRQLPAQQPAEPAGRNQHERPAARRPEPSCAAGSRSRATEKTPRPGRAMQPRQQARLASRLRDRPRRELPARISPILTRPLPYCRPIGSRSQYRPEERC